MKVKIKITSEQFYYLVVWLKRNMHNSLSKLQLINISLFFTFGYKKMIDLNSEIKTKPNRIRTFSIELNQYTSIMECLTNERNNLDPYTLSLFIMLQNQNKQLISLTN